MTNRVWLGLLGGLFLLGGILTLIHPFPASLAINLFAGGVFLILGLLLVITAIRNRATGAGIWLLLLGGIMVLIGVSLLRNPLEGLVALTVVVAVAFVISGLFKLAIGRVLRPARLGWGVMFSGGVSALLGAIVLFNLSASAPVLLGVLLGIEMISTGATALILALSAR
jgi:uncharacterized membrane protein HdeD (DUF308 family)